MVDIIREPVQNDPIARSLKEASWLGVHQAEEHLGVESPREPGDRVVDRQGCQDLRESLQIAVVVEFSGECRVVCRVLFVEERLCPAVIEGWDLNQAVT